MLKITIEGPQGCGKTTIANVIAKVIQQGKSLGRLRPVAIIEPEEENLNPTRPKTKIIIEPFLQGYPETALTVAKKMVMSMDRKQLLALKRHVEVFLM